MKVKRLIVAARIASALAFARRTVALCFRLSRASAYNRLTFKTSAEQRRCKVSWLPEERAKRWLMTSPVVACRAVETVNAVAAFVQPFMPPTRRQQRRADDRC